MRERDRKLGSSEKRLLDAAELCTYLGLGKTYAIEFGKRIGAEKKAGRRCLYDKMVIDHALDEMDNLKC